LAAVEEPAQDPDRLGHLDAAEALERVDRTRLIGDRADPADARGDIRRLQEGASAQERLEEARRLEDAQLDVLDLSIGELDAHRALALDAGQIVGADRPALSHDRPPRGMRPHSR